MSEKLITVICSNFYVFLSSLPPLAPDIILPVEAADRLATVLVKSVSQ